MYINAYISVPLDRLPKGPSYLALNTAREEISTASLGSFPWGAWEQWELCSSLLGGFMPLCLPFDFQTGL